MTEEVLERPIVRQIVRLECAMERTAKKGDGVLGFEKGKGSPCIFHHTDRNMTTVVHGDDFTILGHEEDLDWLRTQIVERFEVKFNARLGPEEKDDKISKSPKPSGTMGRRRH